MKRNVDVDYLRRAFDFIDHSLAKGAPFLLYYPTPHSAGFPHIVNLMTDHIERDPTTRQPAPWPTSAAYSPSSNTASPRNS